MSDLLSKEDIKRLLRKVPEWEHEDDRITRTVEFDSFSDAVDFINDVAEITEEQGHHPDIDIRYNKVLLALTTHDAGGVTDEDFELAQKLDHLID